MVASELMKKKGDTKMPDHESREAAAIGKLRISGIANEAGYLPVRET
jgi:hypothetical protein